MKHLAGSRECSLSQQRIIHSFTLSLLDGNEADSAVSAVAAPTAGRPRAYVELLRYAAHIGRLLGSTLVCLHQEIGTHIKSLYTNRGQHTDCAQGIRYEPTLNTPPVHGNASEIELQSCIAEASEATC